jgi:IstB-like ATP binding protein
VIFYPLLKVPQGLPDLALLEKVDGRVGPALREKQRQRERARQGLAPETLEPGLVQALELNAAGYGWYLRAHLGGFPRPYWAADLNTALQTESVQEVRGFWSPPEPEELDDVDSDTEERAPESIAAAGALILCGPTGIGKTFAQIAGLAYGTLDEELAFFTFGRLVRALLNPEEQKDTLARAIETPIVMIDDLGTAYLKADGLAEALIEEIICERELAGRMLLGTSNLRAARLAEVLGDRVADRLAGSWGRIVEVRGPSLRRQSLAAIPESQR